MQQYLANAMSMGDVGQPVPRSDYDGKIFLERVNKQVTISSLTSHQNFTNDVILNQSINIGEWQQLFDSELPLWSMQ